MKTTFTLAVTGAIGSGKTTLAGRLASRFGCDLLSSDALRASLSAHRQRKGDQVFDLLRTRFEGALHEGRPVILDSTGMSHRFRALLHAHRSSIVHIHLTLAAVDRFEERERGRTDRPDGLLPKAAFLHSRHVQFMEEPDLVIATDELDPEQVYAMALEALLLPNVRLMLY